MKPAQVVRLSGTTRIETFSDGVMAIAITVLILNVNLPDDGGSLLHRLGHLWPSYVGYADSFLTIGVAGGGQDARVAAALYGVVAMLQAATWLIMWAALRRRPEMFERGYDATSARVESRLGWIGVGLFGVCALPSRTAAPTRRRGGPGRRAGGGGGRLFAAVPLRDGAGDEENGHRAARKQDRDQWVERRSPVGAAPRAGFVRHRATPTRSPNCPSAGCHKPPPDLTSRRLRRSLRRCVPAGDPDDRSGEPDSGFRPFRRSKR